MVEFEEQPIDPDKDLELQFDKTYTKYIKFDGLFSDDDLEFDDSLTIMLPQYIESTNCLQF